jgi:hypothetical protein
VRHEHIFDHFRRSTPPRAPRREAEGGGVVSDRLRHATPANRVHAAAALKERQTDEAVRLLLAAVEGELRFIEDGREFLKAAQGLDRGRVVERAAEQVCAELPNASLGDACAVVWRDARRVFGWCDLTTLEPTGAA